MDISNNIPVGRSGFVDIRQNKYYYVDKTKLIEELVKTDGIQVTLITRPRRFGKTLNISMLSEFFDIRKDSRTLFTGLAISQKQELCKNWMNQYPTIFLSFRGVEGLNFESAYAMFASVIGELYKNHMYLMDSEKISSIDKELFYKIASEHADLKEIKNSLLKLTQWMSDYYKKPVILLIDEYDVPLAKASEAGYYNEMLDVIRGVVRVIKDNPALKFAVVTGCLQIAKESIFTGTNNFVSNTISDTRLNEYFGFTQAEVDKILKDTKLDSYAMKIQIKEWYDGYRFGDFDIYCPWDVMNYVSNLLLSGLSKPQNFWENTSANSVIRSFLSRTDFDVNEKFEVLLSGGYVKEVIEEKLTYDVLESSEKNLWTLLYFTGYLTKTETDEKLIQGEIALKIPNREVMDIFRKSVKEWFIESSAKNDRKSLFTALWNGDEKALTEMISDLLFDTISYFDYRESFYHAFLVGLMSNAGFLVESNYENGIGRSDIVVKDRKNRRAAVMELKWTDNDNQMENECRAALQQIEEKQYAVKIEHMGYRNIWKYGISFFRKKCLVRKG